MPERSRGIHGCFLEIYRTSLAAQCGHWARTLPRLVAEDRAAERSALSSIAHSLAQLGVADDECADYLSAELLALRGWAGIVRQIEERPDRVPARDLTVTLRGYLAVRLLFERAALDQAARQLSFGGPLSDLRPWLRNRLRRPPAPTALERAWPLFHVAQLCGLDASIVEQWTARHVAELESELQELDGVRRRRILHQAFERAIRHRLYDALMRSRAASASRAAGVPGGVLPRRAGGIIPPPSGGSRAGLRDVQHGGILQRGDVSPGRVRRSPAAALPRGDPSRPLRGRNRTGRRSPRGTLAPSATARRRVPRLQRASRKPAAGPRCGADDGVRLAGAGPAGPASRVPVALVPMEPRARDVDHRRANPPAAESGGRRAAHRDAFRVHGAGDGGYRAARPRRYRDSRSPVVSRARHRPRIDQSQQPSRVGPRLRCVRGRTRRAERAGLRADGQRPARAPAAGGRGAVHRRDDVVRRRPTQHLRQRGHVLRRGSRPCGLPAAVRASQGGD